MADTTRRVRQFFGGKENSDSDPELEAVQRVNHKIDFSRFNFLRIVSVARSRLKALFSRNTNKES